MAVTEAVDLRTYHNTLIEAMGRSRDCAERARAKEQRRQAKYYDRQVRRRREWQVGDLVWLFSPPRGPKATKFVHPWMRPLRIVEDVGYENYLLRRRDKTRKPKDIVAHASFLTSYKASSTWLEQAAADLTTELAAEESDDVGVEIPSAGAAVRSAAGKGSSAVRAGSKRRRSKPTAREGQREHQSARLVDARRRRRRNKAGQYILEILLQPAGAAAGDEPRQSRWVSISEYDELFDAGKVVKDLGFEEGV
jgi:hypothetical protein